MTTTSALVVDIVDLPHHSGATKDVHLETAAPVDLGTEVIGVPAGSPVVLDAQLTSLEDGVLARGRAEVHVHGECVRCLRDLDEDRTITFDELYYLPEAAARQADEGDDELDDVFLVGETDIDLEPALRDAVVPTLPFRPLCRQDCAGLCPDCGERMGDLPPDHHHERIDPRWAALAALVEPSDEDAADVTDTADTGSPEDRG